MSKLRWGEGPRMFDRGVSHGVLYLGDNAVPWNGLVSLEEVAVGEVDVDHYFDGNRIHITHAAGDFEGMLSAYTYPEVFSEYNGFSPHDDYARFGMSYRTEYGGGYKLHIVYNVVVRDNTRSWRTAGAAPDPSLFNWSLRAAPEKTLGASPSTHLVMEAPANSSVLSAIEDILYGTSTTAPRLPLPAEIIDLYEAATTFRVTYLGDGSYKVDGPDYMVQDLGGGQFRLDAPSIFFVTNSIFSVNSY